MEDLARGGYAYRTAAQIQTAVTQSLTAAFTSNTVRINVATPTAALDLDSSLEIFDAVQVIGSDSAGRPVLLHQAGRVPAAIEGDASDEERISRDGLDVIGSRRSLIEAAWQMWLDHPIRGVGLASYDEAILGPYSAYQGYFGAAQSSSHTALMTTLAELGVFGLAAFVVLAIAVLRAVPRRRGVTIEATLAASLAVVFVSAQAEGRFWEDPLTWLLFGLLVGVVRRRRLEAR